MTRGTTILTVAALLAAGGAFSMRPEPLPPASYEDTGEPLFADFTAPTLATALEVTSWDEDAATVRRFAVEQKEGRWIIPSHNDYPADGTERMGKAAASFVGVKRDLYYGDNLADHAEFGVLDPEGDEGKGDERGQRIRIKDTSGATLVDIIVGKDVEGKQGYHYVRFPDSKRVYASTLELDISTDFADWIEKDLLRVERDDIVTLHYDPYQVDEAQGRVTGSDPFIVNRPDGSSQAWTADERIKVPSGKALDTSKISQMVTAIDNIKIVGVRPRPNPLTLPALQSKGFFVTQDGRRLFGNEGEVSVATKDGVVYTLYFGEVTYESGLALTAGQRGSDPSSVEEEQGEGDDEGEGAKDDKQANRYMFVDVRYDPSLDRAAQDAESEATDEADADASAEDDAEPEGGEPEGGEPGASPAPSKGAERAAKLRERFDSWFYVISDSSFERIHKERSELFKEPEAD